MIIAAFSNELPNSQYRGEREYCREDDVQSSVVGWLIPNTNSILIPHTYLVDVNRDQVPKWLRDHTSGPSVPEV
jgi:hypothetical protein